MLHQMIGVVELDELGEKLIANECSFIQSDNFESLFYLALLRAGKKTFIETRDEHIYIFYKDEKVVWQSKAARAIKMFCDVEEPQSASYIFNSGNNVVTFCKLQGLDDVAMFGGAEIDQLFFAGLEDFTKEEFGYLICRMNSKHRKAVFPNDELKAVVSASKPTPGWIYEKFHIRKDGILIPRVLEAWL